MKNGENMEMTRLLSVAPEAEQPDLFMDILNGISDFISIPLVVLIILGGIWMTICARGVQFRFLGRALRYMFKSEEGGDGDVSSFGALCTALSATIGTGNIVGVATAICLGGPGALFWMEIAALFGMATKYVEGLLAVKYRITDANGNKLGGPFYYIERGMGERWKWLAKVFALFGVFVGLFGIGTFSQINSITSAVSGFFTAAGSENTTLFLGVDMATAIAGIIITVAVALVIIGGIKRISSVSQVVVPFMAALYILAVVTIIICNIDKVPSAFASIIESAFDFKAVAGGTTAGIFVAMQRGIQRGIFSNEAGLGSAPIASAAAKTKDPVRQGLVTMTGTFIDTIVICTMTGLAIIIAGSNNVEGLEGVAVTTHAFQSGLSFLPSIIPQIILVVCLVFFAFTTILGWNYYSERCLSYLTGSNTLATRIFRFVYIAAVAIGPYMTVAAVWTIADIVNSLMAIPNMIALIALSGVVTKETKRYISASRGEKAAKKKKAEISS